MTPEELQNRLQGVINDLQSGAFSNVMIQTANDAIALVKKRVQESGVNAQGQRFRDYSKGYEARKRKAGKFKGFTDFSFTNRMWTNIMLVSSQGELFEGTARITARGQENLDKLNQNTKGFGTILELSDKETEIVRQTYSEGILDIWRNNGLMI